MVHCVVYKYGMVSPYASIVPLLMHGSCHADCCCSAGKTNCQEWQLRISGKQSLNATQCNFYFLTCICDQTVIGAVCVCVWSRGMTALESRNTCRSTCKVVI